MTLTVFDFTPRHPYRWAIERPTNLLKFAGGGEQTLSLLSRSLRTYTLGFRVNSANRIAIDAFLEAAGWQGGSFLWQDLKDSTRTGVSVGTGDGATTVFNLPVTGEKAGDYPLTTGGTAYVDAGSVAATFQTDARTVTYGSAPAGSTALTVDYSYYRRVRLAAPHRWEEPVYGVFTTELILQELPGG